MVSEISFLLRISRPRFWIYVFGPYLIGIAAAAHNSSDFLSVGALIFGFYFLFPANLLIYGVNDLYDYETDKLNPKKTSYETLVTPERRRVLLKYIVAFNFPFLVGVILYFPQAISAMAGFLFFSIGYSAPPIRAKTKPLLDSVFNILYVFPGVFAYSLLSGNYPPLIIIAAAGCWMMAMHAYSAIPDIASDSAAGIATIATWLGANGTLGFCLVCYAISAVLAFQYLGVFSYVFVFAYFVMIALSYGFNHVGRLFDVYRFFPYLNTAIGFTLFWVVAYPKFV